MSQPKGQCAVVERTPTRAGEEFLIVTERGGEPVSAAQLQRFHQRYVWAGTYCEGKDVLEMACGTGPGLGYLQIVSRSFSAGDVSADVLHVARTHYGDRIALSQFDASAAPYLDQTFDVVVLFEAIYYLKDVEAFMREVRRLLRPGGVLLLATANKDLFDFNPSPYSRQYFNPTELARLLSHHGFTARFYGGSPVPEQSVIGRGLRTVKRIAVQLGLIPKTMRGKRLLKRLVFGKLVQMPHELGRRDVPYVSPVPIPADLPDLVHQVLYCAAVKGSE